MRAVGVMLLESSATSAGAIDMGRLSKTTAAVVGRPSFRVHYRKLVDEYSATQCDVLKFVPSLPDYLSYCCHQCGHTQKLQAEELNAIVGNAFRMAYAAQLQKQPTFQDVIASQLDQTHTSDKVLWAKELSNALKKEKTGMINNQTDSMEVQLNNADAVGGVGGGLRLAPPSSIPGLNVMHKYNVLGSSDKSHSEQSTPSSDESNSPTEMNSYKRIAEKPPLIKRLAMGFTNNHHHEDDDSCPLVNNDSSLNSTPVSPTNRPLSGGYVNETVADSTSKLECIKNDVRSNLNEDNRNNLQNLPAQVNIQDYKMKRISQVSSTSSGSCSQNLGTEGNLGFTPTPPPLPERSDSLNNQEEDELRGAPWFQAGIPREIALEILGQEPVGAFMVRESTSKIGCFALSLRVPRNFQQTGIAHYLIVKTNKGYRIKGFTKEFGTLTSLIIHHSVMQELLPCPLSLSRYNPIFERTESTHDFVDIDIDPEYNTLADFRKMMADLNV